MNTSGCEPSRAEGAERKKRSALGERGRHDGASPAVG